MEDTQIQKYKNKELLNSEFSLSGSVCGDTNSMVTKSQFTYKII